MLPWKALDPWQGSPGTCLLLARDQPAPPVQLFGIMELDSKQGQQAAVGLMGMWLFLSSMDVPVCGTDGS